MSESNLFICTTQQVGAQFEQQFKQAEDLGNVAGPALRGALSVLPRQEIVEQLKGWLRTMPAEQRQLVIDELTACTLRTLE